MSHRDKDKAGQPFQTLTRARPYFVRLISIAPDRVPLVPCGVAQFRLFLKYWLPILIWMVVIFSASADSRSFQHSSRIIAPLVRWLFPSLPEESVRSIVFIVRKIAHLTEFAILALLAWRALRRPAPGQSRHWQWSLATQVVLLVMLYAASDEFNQRFVPHREASVVDVMIDTSGAVLALLSLWALGRWRKWW
jgi:VanZ family protein